MYPHPHHHAHGPRHYKPPSSDTRTQLFVANLPFRVRWQDLKDLMRKCGIVLRTDVALNPNDGRSRGFGIVLFANRTDALKAISMYNGYTWFGRVLDVRLDSLDPNGARSIAEANRQQQQQQQHQQQMQQQQLAYLNYVQQVSHAQLANFVSPGGVIVRNLPAEVGWQDLKTLMGNVGSVIRAEIPLDEYSRASGVGYVLFASSQDATAAVETFDGWEIGSNALSVERLAPDVPDPRQMGIRAGLPPHMMGEPFYPRPSSAPQRAPAHSVAATQPPERPLSAHQSQYGTSQQVQYGKDYAQSPFAFSDLELGPDNAGGYAGENTDGSYSADEYTSGSSPGRNTSGPETLSAGTGGSARGSSPGASSGGSNSYVRNNYGADGFVPGNYGAGNYAGGYMPGNYASNNYPDNAGGGGSNIGSGRPENSATPVQKAHAVASETASRSTTPQPTQIHVTQSDTPEEHTHAKAIPLGRLVMPPPYPFNVSMSGQSPLSPLLMTPSMPAFTLGSYPQTPPIAHPFFTPGVGPFTPSSPIGFAQPHMLINPAPGSPLYPARRMSNDGRRNSFLAAPSSSPQRQWSMRGAQRRGSNTQHDYFYQYARRQSTDQGALGSLSTANAANETQGELDTQQGASVAVEVPKNLDSGTPSEKATPATVGEQKGEAAAATPLSTTPTSSESLAGPLENQSSGAATPLSHATTGTKTSAPSPDLLASVIEGLKISDPAPDESAPVGISQLDLGRSRRPGLDLLASPAPRAASSSGLGHKTPYSMQSTPLGLTTAEADKRVFSSPMAGLPSTADIDAVMAPLQSTGLTDVDQRARNLWYDGALRQENRSRSVSAIGRRNSGDEPARRRNQSRPQFSRNIWDLNKETE